MSKEELENNIKNELAKVGELTMVADPNVPELREFYNYEENQILFLHEYKKDYNLQRAAKVAGYTPQGLNYLLKQDKIKTVLITIQESLLNAALMHKEVAASEFIDTFMTCKQLLKSGETKVASAMASMLNTWFKAEGMLNEKGFTGNQIQINIDLSGNKKDINEIEE